MGIIVNFSGLVGREDLAGALSGALSRDAMSHAILLIGPAGSGKKSWGRALARAILCPDRGETGACGRCSSCLRFASGNHPAFFPIKADGRSIKIEQLRAVRSGFFLQGGSKVCLIEDAAAMTPEASSSLLKILEEPPGGLHFILLTELADRLFSTILSRCRQYRLQPLSKSETAGLLAEKGVPAEKASFLADLSGGIPGIALALAADDHFENRLREAEELAGSLASGSESAHRLLARAAALAEREDLFSFLELFCLTCRNSLFQKLSGGWDPAPGGSQAAGWAKPASPYGLEEAVLLVNQAMKEIAATNVNRRLLMEKLLIVIQRRLLLCPG